MVDREKNIAVTRFFFYFEIFLSMQGFACFLSVLYFFTFIVIIFWQSRVFRFVFFQQQL